MQYQKSSENLKIFVSCTSILPKKKINLKLCELSKSLNNS